MAARMHLDINHLPMDILMSIIHKVHIMKTMIQLKDNQTHKANNNAKKNMVQLRNIKIQVDIKRKKIHQNDTMTIRTYLRYIKHPRKLKMMMMLLLIVNKHERLIAFSIHLQSSVENSSLYRFQASSEKMRRTIELLSHKNRKKYLSQR